MDSALAAVEGDDVRVLAAVRPHAAEVDGFVGGMARRSRRNSVTIAFILLLKRRGHSEFSRFVVTLVANVLCRLTPASETARAR